jgi:hypothetical protein
VDWPLPNLGATAGCGALWGLDFFACPCILALFEIVEFFGTVIHDAAGSPGDNEKEEAHELHELTRIIKFFFRVIRGLFSLQDTEGTLFYVVNIIFFSVSRDRQFL